MAPEVMFHGIAGVVGVVSGIAALSTRKGERPHRAAGTVFLVSMILLGASGAWLGFAKGEIDNAAGGILTIYFLVTAWVAARRRDGEAGLFEVGACLFATAGAAFGYFAVIGSLRDGTALLGGVPGFTFATVVALCALADLSVIIRRGLAGTARIARHLWRMHLALAIAVGSFFPGQLQFFPDYIRQIRPTILLFIPLFVVFGLMAYWVVRVRIDGRFRAAPAAAET